MKWVLLRRMLSRPTAHSSCVLDKESERGCNTRCAYYIWIRWHWCRTAHRASNAFNALNRAATLHNTLVLCPIIIAIYAINTYRQPVRLFLVGGKEIVSTEGAAKGDPLAVGLYALSIQLLITSLQAASSVKQCCFTDDASGAGSITESRTRWVRVQTLVIFRTTGNGGSSQNQLKGRKCQGSFQGHVH